MSSLHIRCSIDVAPCSGIQVATCRKTARRRRPARLTNPRTRTRATRSTSAASTAVRELSLCRRTIGRERRFASGSSSRRRPGASLSNERNVRYFRSAVSRRGDICDPERGPAIVELCVVGTICSHREEGADELDGSTPTLARNLAGSADRSGESFYSSTALISNAAAISARV